MFKIFRKKKNSNVFHPKLLHRSVDKDDDYAKYVNSEICSECGGECCKRCGCHLSPNDFKKISFNFLKKEIQKGDISIDYVKGERIDQNFGVYILRVRNQDAPIVDIECKWPTPCILLTKKGCGLAFKNRPAGGRLLIPSKKFLSLSNKEIRECIPEYSIIDCCAEWRPHQEVLVKLIEYFKGR